MSELVKWCGARSSGARRWACSASYGLLVGALGCASPERLATQEGVALAEVAPAQTEPAQTDGAAGESTAATVPRLFFLKGRPGKVLSMNTDGTDLREVFVGGTEIPDGITIDLPHGHVYWTTMGVPELDDGAIMRANLDGSEVTTIVAPGGTFTGKQLALDAVHGMLYWSDREGMRVMRCKIDGSDIETLVTIAQGDEARKDAKNWAVGMALDVVDGMMYWTQKGPTNGNVGSIRRAPFTLPPGQSSLDRTDIEVLFDGLPEPVDLALDLDRRHLYWTDRGDSTINRAGIDLPAGQTATTRTDRAVVLSGLSQPIGITLDLPHGDIYFAEFGGSVGTVKLDGSQQKKLVAGLGFLNGITYVELPK